MKVFISSTYNDLIELPQSRASDALEGTNYHVIQNGSLWRTSR